MLIYVNMNTSVMLFEQNPWQREADVYDNELFHEHGHAYPSILHLLVF